MKVLGAVLAGGRSSRFGSDKAVAIVGGVQLLDRVAEALAVQTDEIIVVGRRSGTYRAVEDHPAPHLGPLAGLCASLRFAEGHAFDAVLTAGCDVLPVPPDLVERLWPGPAIVAGQPLFGFWPSTTYEALLEHLAARSDRSLRAWVAKAGAREVPLNVSLYNLNTPRDLELYCGTERLVR